MKSAKERDLALFFWNLNQSEKLSEINPSFKVLRRETDRQLEYVAYIRHEPKPYELESDGRNYRVLALKELRWVLSKNTICKFQTTVEAHECCNFMGKEGVLGFRNWVVEYRIVDL